MSKRPFTIVPPGLRDWFMREVCGDDDKILPLQEIREVDPTHPGLPEEDMALLRGDYDEDFYEDGFDADGDDIPAEPPAAQERQKPRLKIIPGGRDGDRPGAAP